MEIVKPRQAFARVDTALTLSRLAAFEADDDVARRVLDSIERASDASISARSAVLKAQRAAEMADEAARRLEQARLDHTGRPQRTE